MSVLIKNGTIVTALDQFVGDILCHEGQIVAIGPDLEAGFRGEIVDASGQYVFPGGLDPHVHMELPFMGTVSVDDFETGTAAGVAGGTTSIIDFVVPEKGQDLMESLADWRAKAEKSVSDYAFHMSVTWWGAKTGEWMRRCAQEEGITSFKTFMAYRGAIGIDDVELIEVMKEARQLGALVTVHAEHGDMIVELQNRLFAEGKTGPRYHPLSRPAPVEGEATARAIMLARMVGVPLYVVHMSSQQAVQAVNEARARGQEVIGETCTQYLLLDDSVYQKPGFESAVAVMSPPIRCRGHQEPLWAALRSGIVEVVATDHCPFNYEGQKDMGKDDFRKIPNGAAGIEHRMSLLYTYGVLEGRFDLHRFVELTSTRAAKIFGLYPRKGAIVVGADADLVVWDPAATSVISAVTDHHHCDRSIYEGLEVHGAASVVVAGGRVQFENGELQVERGAGRYLARSL